MSAPLLLARDFCGLVWEGRPLRPSRSVWGPLPYPVPILCSAKQRNADETAHFNFLRGLKFHKARIGIAALGIVDCTSVPACIAFFYEPGHKDQPDDWRASPGRIRVVNVCLLFPFRRFRHF